MVAFCGVGDMFTVTAAVYFGKSVHVQNAGTLSSLLTDYEKQYVEVLTISGKLNGSDIVVLQDMANASMISLDMSDANIVSGGSVYYTFSSTYSTTQYKTSNNVIGKYMFDGTKTLQNVILPNSATTIEGGAFGYSSLRSMTIGPKVTSITAGLCAGTPLNTITIASGNNAFVLSDGILYDKAKTTIYKALSGIEGDIILPSTVTTIMNSSFSKTGLRSIVIPSKVKEIDTGTFGDCLNLEEVTFPSGLTDLGYDCFGGCPKLKKVDLSGTKVTKVYMSFYNCKAIEEVLFPSTLKEITGSSFTSNALKKITCAASTPPTLVDATYHSFPYTYITSSCKVYVPKGRVNTYKTATGWKRFSYIYEIGSNPEDNITPTPGSEEINGIYYLFDDATRTATVTYRGTITGSGMSTQYDLDFKYYKGDITIPSTVTRNGVAYTVKYIGRCAFYQSTLLKSVKMPDTVTEIQLSAFNGCTGLVSVNFGQGLERIKNAAFWGCSSLTNPQFPKSLIYIENHAFPDCTSITSLTLPENLTGVDGNTFSGCTNLTSVTFGPNLTYINYGAFRDCEKLAVVSIPEKVVSISHDAFYGCRLLENINVNVANKTYCSVNGVLYDKSLTNLILCPEGKTGSYEIPSGVQEIGFHGDTSGAFCGCSKLTEVHIPNSVNFIGWMAFSGCSSLQKVVSYIKKPFEFEENSFSTWINGSNEFSKATLYVPNGTKAQYLATNYWYKFNPIEEIAAENEVCDADDMQKYVLQYDSEGNSIEVPLCDEPTFDDDVELNGVQAVVDGSGKGVQPVLFAGGCICVRPTSSMAFRSVSFASKDASVDGGGIKNSGMLTFENCTFQQGSYTIENSGVANIGSGVIGCNIINKYGGRIQITSPLTSELTITIPTAEDVEPGVAIITGISSADNITLSVPSGYAWKYDETAGGIVVYSTAGITVIEQQQVVESIYDASGRKVKGQQTKGLTIQRMSDGTVKKAIIKK